MGPNYSVLQIKNAIREIFTLLIVFMLALVCPSASECGSSLEVNNSLLSKHITQVKNPRLMTINDFKLEYERNRLLDPSSRCSFVIEGDFNKDGYIHYAIVGKYDGPFKDQSVFVAILTVKNAKVDVEFFYKHNAPSDRAFLCLKSGRSVEIENIDKQFDVVLVGFSYGTDYLFAIAWDGKHYIKTMPDDIHDE